VLFLFSCVARLAPTPTWPLQPLQPLAQLQLLQVVLVLPPLRSLRMIAVAPLREKQDETSCAQVVSNIVIVRAGV
jgi:hypothetical protein